MCIVEEMKKAVVLWTGGKDSAFALMESIGKYKIERLITFVPESNDDFMAHSLTLMQAQANSIGLPHECMEVKQPYEDSYREAIKLINSTGIEVLITGDISTVDGYPNWIRQCAYGIMEVDTPLWEKDRIELIEKIVPLHYKIVCSLSYTKYFSPTITGSEFNEALINQLISMEKEGRIDAAGENGEYHTMVLSAPFFKSTIDITKSKIKKEKDFNFMEVISFETYMNQDYKTEIN